MSYVYQYFSYKILKLKILNIYLFLKNNNKLLHVNTNGGGVFSKTKQKFTEKSSFVQYIFL